MKNFDFRIILGIGLILLGLLYFFQEIGLISEVGSLLWAAIFLVGGILFLVYFIAQSNHWWPLIPGATLVGIGILIGIDSFFPALNGDIGGFIFMASLAIAFIFIYFQSRENWWALIPGGVLGTLSLVILLDSFPVGIDTGALFMLGMGLTFFIVGTLDTPHGRMRWAYIPAVILAVIGVIILAPDIPYINYLWPIALILVGLVAIVLSLRKR